MIYDTLFALDGNLKIKPQMVDKWTSPTTSSPGPSPCATGSTSTTARRSPSEDVLASLKRWAARDSLGQLLWTKIAEAEGGRCQDLPLHAQGEDRHRAAGARQAVGRAVHHAQARGRDRPLQADRRLYRLRARSSSEARMEARRQDGLRQEPELQAARRAALGPGRRQGGQGRPRRMARDPRPADGGQRAAEGRDRHDRDAAARPLQGHEGRQEREAGQRSTSGATSTSSASTSSSSRSTIPRSARRCSTPSSRRTSSTP